MVASQTRCDKPWDKLKNVNIMQCREEAFKYWRGKNAHIRFNFNINSMICHILKDDESVTPDDPVYDGSFCDESRMVDTPGDVHWGIYESRCGNSSQQKMYCR